MSESKICNKCGLDKPTTEFPIRVGNTRRGTCRDCRRPVAIRCYYKHHGDNLRKRRESHYKTRQNHLTLIYQYLSTHPCIDCGEPDPMFLEFDHVRGTKSFTISNRISHYVWGRILEEIAKCDVRCLKCHRLKTIKTHGLAKWYKTRGLDHGPIVS